MKPKIKPRNPFVALAKFRKAGTHEKPAKSLRRQARQSLAKAVGESPDSWHKRRCSAKVACTRRSSLLMSV